MRTVRGGDPRGRDLDKVLPALLEPLRVVAFYEVCNILLRVRDENIVQLYFSHMHLKQQMNVSFYCTTSHKNCQEAIF
jgi:hypothetical protein